MRLSWESQQLKDHPIVIDLRVANQLTQTGCCWDGKIQIV
jgi:hypothetical protein